MEEETSPPSDFYLACRNDDVDLVARLLEDRPLEEIDSMEPNNSTALHIACHRNRPKIIRMLLDRGFTRCVRNKYNCVPFEETRTEAARQLFLRPEQSNRFGGRTSLGEERRIWITLDNTNQYLLNERITDIPYKGNSLEYGIFRKNDISQRLTDMPKRDVIDRYLRRAVAEKDLNYFIQAYTAETDFPKYVNDYLLIRNGENGFLQFVQTIYLNEQLHRNYSYVDYCYRCICVDSEDQLSLYQKGSRLLNRTFISASRNREQVEVRTCEQRQPGQYLVTMIFKIREPGSALDIAKMSEFPFEEEVLIMFDNVFEIKDVIRREQFEWDIKIYQSR